MMIDLVEAKSTNGVGPRLKSIKKLLEARGRHLEDYLTPIRKSDGTTNWIVNSQLEESDD